ncbi:MAG TPA: SBBP repeat-containing protein [Bryobacteraceae bacterium]|nr:SBBP repeat-containing protein [Bryobacteraceae bacterium]
MSACAAEAPDTTAAKAQAALARLPLRFEANRGQWGPDVRYAARAAGGALLLTAHGPAMTGAGRRVDITLLGGSAAPRIEGLDPMAARTNYLVGNRDHWRTGIENFTRVAYHAVYPGIDIVYYGNNHQLEYDFVLQPGAEPNAIRMRFRGAGRVELTADGDLAVESGGARFLQKRPVVYQEDALTAARRPVEGRYELLAGDVVGVRVSAYDRSRPLVIDPVVTYSVFVGGSSTDVVTSVATDSKGFIYVGGYTQNGDLLAYGNAVQGSNNGGRDGFIAVLDPNSSGSATWVYFTYLGGARDDAVTAITVDANGLIYATGTTTSSDFPLAGANVSAALSLSSTSTSSVFPTDAFVAIIGLGDGLEYSTYYGGGGNETPNGIGLDQKGLIYIFGTTQSSNLPVTGGAYQSVLWGPSDTFLAVIDRNSSNLVYGTYLGGETADDGRGLAVTPQGLVYFAASTYSQYFPYTGPSYRATTQGVENLVIGVIDPTQQGYASLVYCTYLGGSVIDEVRSLSLDQNGKLVLSGWTLSPDFPVTANAFQPVFGGAGNAFVARVNPAALPDKFLEYSTFVGGTGGDVAYNAITDRAGNIYVTGYTMSTDFPVTKDAIQAQFGNGADTFLVKLNPGVAGKGALLYGTFLGGVGTHVGQGLALTPTGSLFLAGYTTPDWQLTGAQNIYNGGASDGFVAVVK